MIETPNVSVDGIVELRDGANNVKIVLIERKNPPYGWALPGGFVDIGERVSWALVREMQEEITLDVTIDRLLGIYSDPSRDDRFHTVSAVFVCHAEGIPVAADDAKALKVVSIEAALQMPLAFDHHQILLDYSEGRQCVTR